MRIRSWLPQLRRNGFTLLEILVVLVILGMGYALSAPMFVAVPREGVTGVQGVLDAARRIAVRRGAAVRVSFETGGTWRIESGSGSLALLSGTIATPPESPQRLQISPLGSCTLDVVNGREASFEIDLIRCRVRPR